MKKFLYLIALVFATNCFAQEEKNIAGKWKFEKIIYHTTVDSIGQAMVKKMFAKNTMYFNDNGTYKHFVIAANETGTWHFHTADKTILHTADKGTINKMQLKSLTDSSIIVTLDETSEMLYKRIAVDSNDTKDQIYRTHDVVPITTEQLCKKWFLKERFIPNKDATISKLVNEIISGTYFDFKTHGTYSSKIFTITNEGNWKLSDSNSRLILDDNRYWYIKRVTNNELELIKGNINEIWIFSTKP
jgi:hypothetical protein